MDEKGVCFPLDPPKIRGKKSHQTEPNTSCWPWAPTNYRTSLLTVEVFSPWSHCQRWKFQNRQLLLQHLGIKLAFESPWQLSPSTASSSIIIINNKKLSTKTHHQKGYLQHRHDNRIFRKKSPGRSNRLFLCQAVPGCIAWSTASWRLPKRITGKMISNQHGRWNLTTSIYHMFLKEFKNMFLPMEKSLIKFGGNMTCYRNLDQRGSWISIQLGAVWNFDKVSSTNIFCVQYLL